MPYIFDTTKYETLTSLSASNKIIVSDATNDNGVALVSSDVLVNTLPDGFVSCILRNIDNVWTILESDSHVSIGFDSVTTETAYATVFFTTPFTSVGNIICAPDETYTLAGITMGASVDLDRIRIYFYQSLQISGKISWNGSAWEVANGTNLDASMCSYSNGVLTITHPTIKGGGASATIAGVLIPRIGSLSTVYTDITFLDFAGTQITDVTPTTGMNFYFNRAYNGAINSADMDLTYSNIWISGIMIP